MGSGPGGPGPNYQDIHGQIQRKGLEHFRKTDTWAPCHHGKGALARLLSGYGNGSCQSSKKFLGPKDMAFGTNNLPAALILICKMLKKTATNISHLPKVCRIYATLKEHTSFPLSDTQNSHQG